MFEKYAQAHIPFYVFASLLFLCLKYIYISMLEEKKEEEREPDK